MAKQPKQEEKAPVTNTVKDVLDAKGAQSAKNLSQGGNAVKVSLKDNVEVIFTSDYGYIKKGHKQPVSQLAFEIYQKAGVVEKI